MPRELVPVSVVIPAYNAEATIGRALNSIAGQTQLPAEIIVVDDGSADATAETARALQPEFEPARLVVVTQPNAGAGAARNRAIAEATQPYLAFLDADDEWLPEKLARSMDVMRDDDFVLVAHDYLDHTPSGDVHVDCRRRFEDGRDPYLSLYLKGYIPSISVVTRRDAVLACGGFDETLRNAQDFDLWLKLLADPESRFTLFGEALARYRHDAPNSIMSHTDRRIACCRKIALRYLPALKARRIAPLPAFWHRLLVIYAEAMRADPKRRFAFGLGFAGALFDLTASYLSGGAEISAADRERTSGIAMAAAWSAGVIGLYLYQFRDMLRPILHVLGFAP